MSLPVEEILTLLESHALTLGRFDRVNRHEPKAAPGSGITVAIWADYIGPFPQGSGLAATTGLVVFMVRLYTNMLAEPQDSIDLTLLQANDLLLEEYTGDFKLSGNVRNIDLHGQSGTRLESRAGYLTQDQKLFRVMTITVPLIINDMWPQAA